MFCGLVATATATGGPFHRSAASGQIAFIQGSPPCVNGDCISKLVVVNPDGSGLRTLRSQRDDATPQWSPNGGEIAFTHGTNRGCCELMVMKADGSAQRVVLAGFPTSDSNNPPSWSADGRTIIFADDFQPGAAKRVYGPFWLYSVAVQGKAAVRRLFRLPGTSTWFDARESPNGRWIALAKLAGATGLGQIWLVKPNGKDLHLLTGAIEAGDFGDLAWSPDSTRIAFNAYAPPCTPGDPNTSPGSVLWTVGAGGGAATQAWTVPCPIEGAPHRPPLDSIASAADVESIGWTPDGHGLVFQGFIARASSLGVVDLTTGTITAIPVALIPGCHGPSGSATEQCGLADPDWSRG